MIFHMHTLCVLIFWLIARKAKKCLKYEIEFQWTTKNVFWQRLFPSHVIYT